MIFIIFKNQYVKEFMLLTLILLLISVCYAADNDTNQAVPDNTIDNTVKQATLTELSDEINSSGSAITLNRNYAYSSDDNNEGIFLNKSNYVLDGNGYSIDAKSKSGIFNVYGKNITIKNIILTNSHLDSGSALYVNKGSDLTTINITFKDGIADESGVIYVENAVYNSINDTILNCNSIEKGVITIDNSNITVDNAYMTTNYTLDNGFIYSVDSSSIKVTNSTFADSCSKYSTAIHSDKELYVENSKFNNLLSEFTAGAIASKNVDKTVTIINTSFNNITSQNNGGAIFIDVEIDDDYNESTLIKSSNFTDCSSSFGGAILQLGGKITVEDSKFTNNIVDYDGAGIYTSNADLTITNSIFENNENNLEIDEASAVYFDMGNLIITNSTFTNNHGADSAIYLYDSRYNIYNNVFKDNKVAVKAFFSNGTVNDNQLNGDTLSLNNTDYATYVSEEGVKLKVVNPIPTDDLPSSYDYRTLGYVTPVKNQGVKSSCWAFATCAAIESSILKLTNKSYDLSENIIFNSMIKYSKYGAINNSEFVSFYRPVGSLISWIGTYPQKYDQYDELAKISPILDTNETIHIQDMMIIDKVKSVDNINKIKEAIYKYGGVFTSTSSDYNNPLIYNEETFAYYRDEYDETDHAVTIVGWDDNFSKNNFATKPAGDGAWIIKNSYGSKWGDNGYYYLSYYDEVMLEVNGIVYIVNNTINYGKNYQTDTLGCEDNYLTSMNGSHVYYVNRYTMAEDDYLAAVGTYFNKKGVEYEIQIYVNDDLKISQNGTSPYHGYTTIKLNNYIPVKEDDTVTVQVKSNRVPIQEGSRQHYIQGTSLYSQDFKKWTDLSEENYTACLKLYTIDDTSIKASKEKTRADYTITLYDEDKNVLKNTEVIVKINDSQLILKTDASGEIRLGNILGNGKYKVEITNPSTEESFTDYLDFRIKNNDKNVDNYTYRNTKYTAQPIKNKNSMIITIPKHNYLTLEKLNNIFGMNFTNGHLLVYIDGILVFNATTTDDLTQVIYDLINILTGTHELKIEFTDNNGNTQTYTENITV